jgi:hypothetical protein
MRRRASGIGYIKNGVKELQEKLPSLVQIPKHNEYNNNNNNNSNNNNNNKMRENQRTRIERKSKIHFQTKIHRILVLYIYINIVNYHEK